MLNFLLRDVYKRQVLDCFSKIDSSSKYLLSLINDILDMSKIESGKVTLNDERFDFSEMIHEINEIIYLSLIHIWKRVVITLNDDTSRSVVINKDGKSSEEKTVSEQNQLVIETHTHNVDVYKRQSLNNSFHENLFPYLINFFLF